MSEAIYEENDGGEFYADVKRQDSETVEINEELYDGLYERDDEDYAEVAGEEDYAVAGDDDYAVAGEDEDDGEVEYEDIPANYDQNEYEMNETEGESSIKNTVPAPPPINCPPRNLPAGATQVLPPVPAPPLSASNRRAPQPLQALGLDSVRIRNERANLRHISILAPKAREVKETTESDSFRFSQVVKKFKKKPADVPSASKTQRPPAPPIKENSLSNCNGDQVTKACDVTKTRKSIGSEGDEDIYEDPELLNKEENQGSPDDSFAGQTQEPLTIAKFDWYWKDADRTYCEKLLRNEINKDGVFMVRLSKNGGADAKYAISLTFSNLIYHLLVRQRSDGKYAVGNQKENEMTFDEVWDMIHFYKNTSLELLPDIKRNTKLGYVKLLQTPKADHR